MPKTIVCIIEEEMILNYLFIKELFNTGDKVFLISQQQYMPIAKRFQKLFPQVVFHSIFLAKDGDEDLWDTICRTIRNSIKSFDNGDRYAVNLSSGTRLMSIAVQQVFEPFDSQFYFMPHDRNVIILSQIDDNNDNNDDEVIEIKHKVTIEEYFRVNDIETHHKQPTQSEEYTNHFLALFTQNMLSGKDFDILEKLRELRDKHIDTYEVEGLSDFLHYTGFTPVRADALSPIEIQYLTGNWFEEYIYHAIKRTIAPTDIAIGVDIKRKGSNQHNDLDVVFTHKNRLFAIECKTGVGRASLYHQIVYKACALKEALLGMRSNGYIFSLNEDHKDNLRMAARNMGITFCDRTYAQEPQRLKNLFLNPKMYL